MTDLLVSSLATIVLGFMVGMALSLLLFHRWMPLLLPDYIHENWRSIRRYCWGFVAVWLLWTFVISHLLR
jgi:uncharacterized membrane protein YccC